MAIVVSGRALAGSDGLHYSTAAPSAPLGTIPRRPPAPQIFAAAVAEPPSPPDPMAALNELDPAQRAACLDVLRHFIANYQGPYAALNARRSA